MRLAFLLSFMAPLLATAYEKYTAPEKAVRDDPLLTADNWTSEVLESKHVFVVEYFSKMCSSCKMFEKTWDKLAGSLESEFRIARVDIDSKAGMQLAKDQGVLKRGIPAVQIVAGSHGEIIMAGKIDTSPTALATLKSKVHAANERYRPTKHPDTGLWVHHDFYSEL